MSPLILRGPQRGANVEERVFGVFFYYFLLLMNTTKLNVSFLLQPKAELHLWVRSCWFLCVSQIYPAVILGRVAESCLITGNRFT